MPELQIKSLRKTYGSSVVLDDVDLNVGKAELVALLGPSGCGKTTLLRSIAGFIPVTSGTITVDGKDITRNAPNKRNTGMVFQNYALFPNMTVEGNVAFGLEVRRVQPAEIRQRVAQAIELVSLSSYAQRYPRQLSGGQQQRVAVARALVVNPDVFLLDEPLSNLDAKLRLSVGQQLRDIQQRLGLTTVFVTHDQKEALMMADRLVIMRGGKIVQMGTAEDLYRRPATRFVADFLGSSNVLAGKRSGQDFHTTGGLVVRSGSDNAPSACVLALRPENIRVGQEADGLPNRFEGRVKALTYLGAVSEIEVEFVGGETVVAHRQNRTDGHPPLEINQQISVGWTPQDSQLLVDDMPILDEQQGG